jgi:hypothetical protein
MPREGPRADRSIGRSARRLVRPRGGPGDAGEAATFGVVARGQRGRISAADERPRRITVSEQPRRQTTAPVVRVIVRSADAASRLPASCSAYDPCRSERSRGAGRDRRRDDLARRQAPDARAPGQHAPLPGLRTAARVARRVRVSRVAARRVAAQWPEIACGRYRSSSRRSSSSVSSSCSAARASSR